MSRPYVEGTRSLLLNYLQITQTRRLCNHINFICNFTSTHKPNGMAVLPFFLSLYKLLYVLEFNISRERMSVMVRHEGEFLLLCRGADRWASQVSGVKDFDSYLLELNEEQSQDLMRN